MSKLDDIGDNAAQAADEIIAKQKAKLEEQKNQPPVDTGSDDDGEE